MVGTAVKDFTYALQLFSPTAEETLTKDNVFVVHLPPNYTVLLLHKAYRRSQLPHELCSLVRTLG